MIIILKTKMFYMYIRLNLYIKGKNIYLGQYKYLYQCEYIYIYMYDPVLSLRTPFKVLFKSHKAEVSN